MLCITLNVNKKRVLLVKCCPSGNSKKWSRSPTGAVVYESSLRADVSGFHNPGRN